MSYQSWVHNSLPCHRNFILINLVRWSYFVDLAHPCPEFLNSIWVVYILGLFNHGNLILIIHWYKGSIFRLLNYRSQVLDEPGPRMSIMLPSVNKIMYWSLLFFRSILQLINLSNPRPCVNFSDMPMNQNIVMMRWSAVIWEWHRVWRDHYKKDHLFHIPHKLAIMMTL